MEEMNGFLRRMVVKEIEILHLVKDIEFCLGRVLMFMKDSSSLLVFLHERG